jgi:hypothetical protein
VAAHNGTCRWVRVKPQPRCQIQQPHWGHFMPTQPLKAASQNTEALAIGISATPSSSRRYTLDSYSALSLFRTLNTNSSPEKASDTVLAHERLAKVSIDISMNDVAPYTYQLLDDPEDQIRLFKYKRIDGAIHCEISAFDALETPPYKTLSYVWGPPYPNFDIFIDGRRLPIRANLFAWFQEDGLHPSEYVGDQSNIAGRKNLFQSVDEEDWQKDVDWMWIDQICI